MTQRFAILAGNGLGIAGSQGGCITLGYAREPPVDHIPLAELCAKKKRATFLGLLLKYRRMHRLSLFGRFLRPSAPSVSCSALAALLFVCSALDAETTTVELSPLVAKSTQLGPLEATREIGVTLTLASKDPDGAANFVRHVSMPGDPLFRHYLTPQQFAERFGGNAADYAHLKSWAVANGLRVTHESIGRINLTVRGSVSRFQSLFNTVLNRYRSPEGQEFYSAGIEPIVPNEIASRISGVIGLTESRMAAPMIRIAKRLGENPPSATELVRADTAGGTGPGGTYKAADLRTAYDIPGFGNLNPKVVAAVFEQGGYDQSDVTKYLEYNHLPQVTLKAVSVDGSPTGAVDPNIELEAVLDIDMIAGINPAISGVLVYIDSSTWDPFATALLDAITQVGDDNIANVFSISYGADEGSQGHSALEAENTALAQLAAQGITVTASSGDDGAYGGRTYSPYNVADPASQPYVTGVGGTTLLTGPYEEYIGETAWNDLELQGGATGGGISAFWHIPDFQSKLPDGGVTWETGNGGSAKYRNVPDISAVADPLTGVGVYSKINGGWVQVGGTSVSSPIWGGYISIVDAGLNYAGLGNLGYFNPILYWVGTPNYGEGVPTDWLYPVVQGSNGYPGGPGPGYSNGRDYSNTTGNGSLFGSYLASELLISGSQPGTPPGPINHFAITTLSYDSASFEWSPVSGATAYVMSLNGLTGASQVYVTKGTKLTVQGLSPHTYYWFIIWAINASGFSDLPIANFTTPSKPKP